MSWLRRLITRSWMWLRSFESFTVPAPTITEEDVRPTPAVTSPLPKFVHVLGLGNNNADTAASWLVTYALLMARSVFTASEFVAFVTAHCNRADQVKVQTGLLILKTDGYISGTIGWSTSAGLITIEPKLFNYLEKRQPEEVIEVSDGEEVEEA